jgi:hypothetical protein
MLNNFRVQSFSSCHTKFQNKFEFQMNRLSFSSKFQFYLANQSSNEVLPEMKVVGNKILNNFHIQIFGEVEVKLS